ncbi:acetyltransferase [Pedobacter sp.]
MKKDLVLIGGGGHCKSCIDVIEHTNEFNIIGILDQRELIGSHVLGYEVIGTDDDLLKFKASHFLITVGQIKSNLTRKKIYKNLLDNSLSIATVISPNAHVSKHAKIGAGTIIMHHAIVNSESTIGNNCIVNTKALIEHDTIVGHHCHISTAAVLNGNCNIGNDVFIGSNAAVANHITIKDNVVVGAGVTVIRNITTAGIFTGKLNK